MIINHDSAATEMIIASVNEKSVEFKPIPLMPYQHILRCLQYDHTLLLLEGVLLVLRRVLPVYYSQKYKNNEYNTGLDMGKGI